MCLIGILYPIAAIAYNVLKVRSNGAIILRLEIVKKVAMTIILAITIPISTMAVAWGMVAASACEMILNIGATLRYAGLGLKSLLRTLLPIICVTATMYFVTMWIGGYVADMAVALRLLIKISVGIATYTAIACVTGMEAFGEVKTIALQFITKARKQD